MQTQTVGLGLLSLTLFVWGGWLRFKFNKTLDLGYGVGAQWMICLGFLPGLLALAQIVR
jgi:hypothetical protein